MGIEETLFIGQRISVSGSIGTIKYIGAVPPTNGDWIGVDWDDPNRGKHDGTKDGVRYFECRSIRGGSFVRPQKIATGISICEALLERYVSYSEHDRSFSEDELYFVDSETSQKTKVEAVGMEKVQKQFEDLQNLTVVGLRMQMISSAKKDGFVLKQATNVEDLDLSRNLFHDWENVATICLHLQSLVQLNVSDNILKIPQHPTSLTDNFSHLRIMIINGCHLTWGDVITCSEMWPQIVELHLERNQISEITLPPQHLFTELKLLNISGNHIQNWDNVLNLSKFPCLEQLMLNGCCFTDLTLSESDFPLLKQIYLSNNEFDSLEVFNHLNKLQSLDGLMFRRNPILQKETSETMREIIIAKMGRLQKLNKSVITDVERQGSELDYMKRYGRQWRESGGHQDPEKNLPSKEFLEQHPRYNDLIKQHGARDDAEFCIKTTALKGNLLEVKIEVPDKPEIKPFLKKLPTSMTTGAVKRMISHLTKLPLAEIRLVYISRDNPLHVVEMSKDAETLHYISIENGDTIEVRKAFYFRPARISWAAKHRKPKPKHE